MAPLATLSLVTVPRHCRRTGVPRLLSLDRVTLLRSPHPRRTAIALLTASVVACTTPAADAVPAAAAHQTSQVVASPSIATPPARSLATATSATTSSSARTSTGASSADTLHNAPPPGVVRGIYVNRFAAESPRKMRALIALADSTEINAFVIDIKDEFGINYTSADTLVRRNGGHGGVIADLPALLDTLKAHHILPIARIVVFKDSVAARVNPQWTIRTVDGAPWRDKKGLTWVNPYDQALWEYDFRVAEDAARLGFAEIQFDYIRFPEPYKSLPMQVFPGAGDRRKPEVLAEFLRTARSRLDKYGVRTTADIFGMVTSVPGALEVGQQWEQLAPHTDALLPMVYPSHYPAGSFNVAHPNADPYKVVFAAVSAAHKRDMALGITGERVRPWLQAFTLGAPRYGPAELSAQKRAVYDAGYQGWVLWNPGSQYQAVESGLARKTPPPAATPAPTPAPAPAAAVTHD